MLPPPTSPPAGRHRHGQVRLLAALRVARTPQQCGRPHQLRPVENIQQLRFCVSIGKDRFRMFRYKDVSRTRTTTKKKKTFMCRLISRQMIPHSVGVSFILAARPSVIQTVTFLTAAGSIRPAQRHRWRPRGPVVKRHYHQTWQFAHTHTHKPDGGDSAGSRLARCLLQQSPPDVLCEVILHQKIEN